MTTLSEHQMTNRAECLRKWRNEMNPKGPNLKVVPIMLDGDDLLPKYAHGVEDAGCDLKANIPNPITIEPWKSVWVARECIWRCRRHVRAPGTAFGAQLQPRHHARKRARHHRPRLSRRDRCKLVNLSDEPYTVYPLERIAQLVFLPFVNAVFTTYDSLPESSRGEDGYGSTGAL